MKEKIKSKTRRRYKKKHAVVGRREVENQIVHTLPYRTACWRVVATSAGGHIAQGAVSIIDYDSIHRRRAATAGPTRPVKALEREEKNGYWSGGPVRKGRDKVL